MKSTANAIDSRFSEPTINQAGAVVIDRPINSVAKTAKIIFDECSAIQRINSTTSNVADAVDDSAILNGANSSLAVGTGPSAARAPGIRQRD